MPLQTLFFLLLSAVAHHDSILQTNRLGESYSLVFLQTSTKLAHCPLPLSHHVGFDPKPKAAVR